MVARAPTCIVKAWKEAFRVVSALLVFLVPSSNHFYKARWVWSEASGARFGFGDWGQGQHAEKPSLEQCIVKPGKPNQSIGSAIFIGFRHVIVPHLLTDLGNCIWAGSSFGICGR